MLDNLIKHTYNYDKVRSQLSSQKVPQYSTYHSQQLPPTLSTAGSLQSSQLTISQPQSIQLISFHQKTQKLYLTQEGRNFLNSVKEPVSVVTIAGLYRTGKSYLVNQLINQVFGQKTIQSKKFTVGNTVQSVTKGLNIWNVPLKSQPKQTSFVNSAAFQYLIIDSQGIGSMEKQANYDMNILLLVFLISSTVIYNSVGAIDEQGLDQLRVLLNLKQCLLGSAQKQSTQSIQRKLTQPKLIWALRDFSLQLVNKNNQEMTPNQYLEQCLEQTNSIHKQTVKKNQIRQAIKAHLPNRECVTLVRPTHKQSDLNNLDQLSQNQLRPQFMQTLQTLSHKAFSNHSSDIKRVKDRLINGQTLVQLIEFYLMEINCNKLPQVNTIYALIEANQFDELSEQCEEQLKKESMKINLPMQETVLKSKLNQIQDLIWVKYFGILKTKDAFQGNGIFLKSETFVKFRERHVKLSRAIMQRMLRVNSDIHRKKSVKQVRDIINAQLEFDKIDACGLTKFSQTLSKLKLKERKQPEAYEYVLQTLNDFLHIAQQKSIKLRDNCQDLKGAYSSSDGQLQLKEKQILQLKQFYHDSLKQIQSLKQSQLQRDQLVSAFSQQQQVLRQNMNKAIQQKKSCQESHKNQLQKLHQQAKAKNQETLSSIRKLRQQNQALLLQLEQSKQTLESKQRLTRKEIIFEQKIQQSWDKFDEERKYLKEQLNKYKDLHNACEQQLISLREKHEKLSLAYSSQKQSIMKKEKEFCEQLKWMKENYAKSKTAYNKTQHTKSQNQRILQDITTRSSLKNIRQAIFSDQKLQGLSETDQQEQYSSKKKNSLQKYESSSSEMCLIQHNNEQLGRLEELEKQMKSLKAMIRVKDETIDMLKRVNLEDKQSLKQKCRALQNQLFNERTRFNRCLQELQLNKQRQRTVYQDSISRLLANMNKIPQLRALKENSSVKIKLRR